jgi:8-oxo-dGTP pyrophosphatase MutT (NUDIX family)
LKSIEHGPFFRTIKELNRKLVGHYNYFGLRSNEKSVGSFYSFVIVIECAFKWLNRRGGKRRSFNWADFNAALKKLGVARPRIVEKQRQHVAFA